MILKPGEVDQLLEILDRQFLFFTASHLGPEFLSYKDKRMLNSLGIDYQNMYSEGRDPITLNFQLGMLSEVLGSEEIMRMTFPQLRQYIEQGRAIPLNQKEKRVIQSVKNQSLSDIRSIKGRIFNDVNSIINEGERDQRHAYEKIIRDEVVEGLSNRESIRDIARNLARKTGDWSRDFQRIVQYISHAALNEGRASIVERKYDGAQNAEVYFQVQPGACKHCIKHYLTGGWGSAPRIFTLEQLYDNGSNIGRKVNDWEATVHPLHPHSLIEGSTLVLTEGGYRSIRDIEVGEMVLTHRGRFRKVTATIKDYPVTTHYPYKNYYEIKYRLNAHTNGGERVLKLTEEHKVLTDQGWVQAKDLVLGKHKLVKITQPCSCGCGEYVDVLPNAKKTYSDSCRKKIKRETALLLKDNSERNKKISNSVKKRWEEGVYEKTRELLKSEKRRQSTRKRMLEGGALNALRAAAGTKTSKIQLKLYEKVKKLYPQAELEYEIFNRSLDIALPDLRVDIEFDGPFHDLPTNQEADRIRDDLLHANNWHILRYKSLPSYSILREGIERVSNNSENRYRNEFTEIISIKEHKLRTWTGGRNYLFDITVDEDESFVARGVIIHNCRCLLTEMEPGMKWEDGKWVEDESYTPAVERPKVRVVFDGKEYFV